PPFSLREQALEEPPLRLALIGLLALHQVERAFVADGGLHAGLKDVPPDNREKRADVAARHAGRDAAQPFPGHRVRFVKQQLISQESEKDAAVHIAVMLVPLVQLQTKIIVADAE